MNKTQTDFLSVAGFTIAFLAALSLLFVVASLFNIQTDSRNMAINVVIGAFAVLISEAIRMRGAIRWHWLTVKKGLAFGSAVGIGHILALI